jgi:hypothetical protein
MALVAAVDYPNKRIILGVDSVGVDIQPMDLYVEMRARRRLNADNDRKFFPMLLAEGNEPAGPSNTPRRVVFADGVRIIPFNVSHILRVRGSMVSKIESLAGPDLFDRSTLGTGIEVDIDYQPPQVEIIERGTSGLTPGESSQLATIVSVDGSIDALSALSAAIDAKIDILQSLTSELHQINGLKDGTPAESDGRTFRRSGSINQDIADIGGGIVRVTRNDP